MDPLLWRMDWEVMSEVIITIIVLSFLVERALAVVVENKLFVNSRLDDSGIKEFLAFALSFAVVKVVSFDALAILFKLEAPVMPGFLITAGIVAGGSKASIKLFHDLLDLKSGARRQKDEMQKIEREAAMEAARIKVSPTK